MQEKINILNELKEAQAITLIQADNRNYYAVPEGYFTGFSSDVMANIFIDSLPLVNPYVVPGNYFDALPNVIIEKIKLGSFNQHGITQKNVYSVPDGYFNSFADGVLKKIKTHDVQQELEEIAPLLNKISKDNLYALPENYFEQLNPLPAGNQNQSPAKVISLGNKARKWVSYAAAACIGILVLSGGYFFVSGKKNKLESAPVAVSSKIDIQKELEGLSDSEIEGYLKENGSMAVFTNVGVDDELHQAVDIQTLIDDIPDEEIQQYLNEEKPVDAQEGI